MLNSVIIMGRLTDTPELRKTAGDISVTSFTVAVERSYKTGDEKQTDFINVTVWRNTAEFVAKYFKKGQMIAVQGSLQVRNYEDKNGNKRTAYDVVADNISFCGSKNEDTAKVSTQPVKTQAPKNPFEIVESEGETDDESPF